MRRLVLVAGLVAILAPSALAGNSKPVAKSHVVKATGEIKALGLDRVTVGKLTCRLGTRAAGVGRFVISDPVAITCKSGVLQGIKYLPAPPILSKAGSVTIVPRPASTAGTGSASTTVIAAVTVLTPGFSTSPTVTARGPLTAFDANSLTVGDLTCSAAGLSASPLFKQLESYRQAGTTITLTCAKPSSSAS